MTNDWLIVGLPAPINPAVCPRPAIAAIGPAAKYQHQAHNEFWIIKQMARKNQGPPQRESLALRPQ